MTCNGWGVEKMEVRVGQWVRKGEHIGEITTVHIGGYYIKCKTLRTPFNYVDSLYYKEWKVANTPQELIKIGDLVALDHHPNYIKQVLDVSGSLISFNSSRCVLNQVCKILTPNSNGGYDLQWEAE